jgi:hypothetical protein
MTRTLKLLAAAALAAVLGAGFGAGPAHAAAPQPSPALRALMKQYPGARVVDADTVTIAPGVDLSLPAPTSGAGVRAAASVGCNYRYLCLFSEPNYEGYRLDLYDCGFIDLGSLKFPYGSNSRWNDKMTSFIDNQTPNTVTNFYNWDGRWVELIRISPWFAVSQLDWTINDTTDGVHVC